MPLALSDFARQQAQKKWAARKPAAAPVAGFAAPKPAAAPSYATPVGTMGGPLPAVRQSAIGQPATKPVTGFAAPSQPAPASSNMEYVKPNQYGGQPAPSGGQQSQQGGGGYGSFSDYLAAGGNTMQPSSGSAPGQWTFNPQTGKQEFQSVPQQAGGQQMTIQDSGWNPNGRAPNGLPWGYGGADLPAGSGGQSQSQQGGGQQQGYGGQQTNTQVQGGGQQQTGGGITNQYQRSSWERQDNQNMSKEVKNALQNYSNMGEVSGPIGQMQNPSDVWNPVTGGAQQNLQNLFNGNPNQGPPGQDYLNDSRNRNWDMINNAPGQQPQSQRPDLMGPGGPYQNPDTWGQMSTDTGGGAGRFTDTAYQAMNNPVNAPGLNGVQQYNRPGGPQFDYANQGVNQFDPNRVGGPNLTGIQGSGLSMSGNAGTPGFNEALDAARGFGRSTNIARENIPGPVGRENIQGSGFAGNELFSNPNSVANRGYNASLAANQGLANANVNADTGQWDEASKAVAQDTMRQAAQAAREATGARGFTSAEGDVTGLEMGRQLGFAGRQIAADRTKGMLDARLQAVGLQGQQRMAGAQGLTSLGSAASQSGVANAGLLQGENQFLGGAAMNQRSQDIGQNETRGGQGIEQRGQDIQNAQFGAGLGSQNLQGVASLINATGGQGTDYQRMLNERGRLGLDTQAQQQTGELGGYNAQTGRMGTQGDIVNQGQQNRTSQFQAETGRGLGEEAGRRAAEAQGLDWNTLDATQRDNLNQRANEQYATGVNQQGNIMDAAGNMTQTLGNQNIQSRQLEYQARNDAAQRGVDYDTLSADERARYNQEANSRYQTDVSGELGRGNQANSNYQAQLGAGGNMYSSDVNRQQNEITQQRDQLNNAIQTGQLANDVLSGKQSGQQAANALVASGLFQDQNAALQFVFEMTHQEQNRWQTNRGNQLTPGGVLNAGATVGSAFIKPPSDVNLKENFTLVDGADVLAKIAAIPVSQWNYKTDDPGLRHIGPMAQDFHKAFPLNGDDKHIDLIDANGVLLVAVKELARENSELQNKMEMMMQWLRDLTSQRSALGGSLSQQPPWLSGGVQVVEVRHVIGNPPDFQGSR